MGFFVANPITNNNRPGIKITPTTVTVHNTADPGATAKALRNYLQNNAGLLKSFHWAVDATEAINLVPENEEAWHAGCKQGNMTSIGVEVCEPKDRMGVKSPEWPKIYRNAVILVTDILLRYNWTTAQIRQHYDWTKKDCPRLLRPMWSQFISDVQKELDKHRQPAEPPQEKAPEGYAFVVHAGGAFTVKDNAQGMVDALKAKGFTEAFYKLERIR